MSDKGQLISIKDRRTATKAADEVSGPTPRAEEVRQALEGSSDAADAPPADEPAGEAKVDAALSAVADTAQVDEAAAALEKANRIWATFESRARETGGRVERWLLTAAIKAHDEIVGAGLQQVWANVGVAVQTARMSHMAALEMGAATAMVIREIEKRVGHPNGAPHPPLDLGPLDKAREVFEKATPPRDLPEGSVRTDPVAP